MTVLLCFLVALCEGFDIQSAGVTAAGLSHDFQPSSAALGLLFSASGAGLLCGALVGGPLSDRIGRKAVLIGSAAAFGICSLLTSVAPDMASLTGARFLTGIGLGGAMPTMIAIVADTTARRFLSGSVACAYVGMPLGAVAASLCVFVLPLESWRTVFLMGGIAPLALVPFLMRYLPKAQRTVEGAASPIGGKSRLHGLFAARRARTTLLLWTAFFLIALTLHLMLNWLPLLLVGRGLLRGQAALAQAGFNVVGAAVALAVGVALDRRWRRAAIGGTLLMLPAALVMIAAAPAQPLLLMSLAALLGGAIVAAQAIIYAVASASYPLALRGTGMGAAVAAGRIGSLVGPMFAALLLGAGRTPSQVLTGVIPIVVVCGICVAMLSWRDPRTIQ